MNNCHHDNYLDSLIGRSVTITFKDASVETGILTYPDYGFGYKLITPKCDVIFCKSFVRCITTNR